MTAAVFALRPGDVFQQRYTVVRCIATGGMGSVYEVSHNATRRRCALKVMLPSLVADRDLRARFQTEATITAQIGSEHIVDVLDAGVDPATGTPFIVMELLVGEELCERLVRHGAMPPAEVIELLRQAALALDRTHALGIIHRDLKPENFFLAAREDGSVRIKILDFGIAKVVAESAYGSRQTGTMGTPLYMPPEQVDGTGSISFQADLYSFAQVTYAMLTGEPYFDEDLRAAGGVFGLLTRVMGGPREPASQRARRRRNVTLPPAFDAWFAKASARRPEERFQRASAQVAALAEALGLPPPAPRASQPALPQATGRPDAPLGLGVSALPARLSAAPMLSAAPALPAAPAPLVHAPHLTGVPVSSDASLGRRAAASPRRWLLPAAAAGLALSVAAFVWLALDVGRGAGELPAAASAQPATGEPASAAAAPPATATVTATSAAATASATASAAPTDTPAASAAATASAAPTASSPTPARAATTAPSKVSPKPSPKPKPKSVLDVGP